MELSIEGKAILAHVVENPDEWVTHALGTVGEKAVTAKIERWRHVYLAEKDKSGYKNRVARDAEEEAARQSTPEQIAEQEKESLIQTKIREQAITALKIEGVLTADGKIAEKVVIIK